MTVRWREVCVSVVVALGGDALAQPMIPGPDLDGPGAPTPVVHAPGTREVRGVIGERGTTNPIAGATVAGSLLFFTLSNFGVWAFGGLYPHTGGGLAACFIAALPFLGGTLEGDGLYSLVLFGGFALLARNIGVLRESDPVLAPA